MTPQQLNSSINAAVTVRPRKEAKNEKYANDGSFESVDAMLQGLAVKCFKRVQAQGLSMTFEDVRAQMDLGYVQARAKWSPDRGTRFATYCQTVCLNNFNNAVEKPARERELFGMVSLEGLSEDESGEGGETVAFSPTDLEPSPLDRAVAVEEARARLASLTPPSRRLMAALLASEFKPSPGPAPRLREIAEQCRLTGEELRKVKREILEVFGVRWN